MSADAPTRLARDAIDAAVRDVMEQIPGLDVTALHVLPAATMSAAHTSVRLDLADGAYVVCEIDANGRLQSARVVET